MHKRFFFSSLIAALVIALISYIWDLGTVLIIPFLILFGIGIYDMLQSKHSLRRNFPLIGRMRWVLEAMRPPIRQYFVESDIDGVPISRQLRGLVYRRSKNEINTVPFGTKMDVYAPGYEWISHSLNALDARTLDQDPRVLIGSSQCSKPYSSSVLNISAMSYGALSQNAILALGYGAKRGGFAHNTGEGGISDFHLKTGADLIWQIGTGYFGCRDREGRFDPQTFSQKATLPQVKMIEIKLSQGAKPGHGGILPADKNTPEIARMRGLEPHTQVDSPPTHSAFSSPLGLLDFIQELRALSGGKPVGFKLAIGRKVEFIAICKAIVERGIYPDFITIDGGEGGTGAAPLEHTNSVGMPLREALAFVSDMLAGFDIKKEIKIIVSGKIFTGMDMIKMIALGADACASARGFMLSLGCIQALQCHRNNCPSGIATQDKKLANGLVVSDKEVRVANFHKATLHSFVELFASAGLPDQHRLDRYHIYYRISPTEYQKYDTFFPPMDPGSLLSPPYPKNLERYLTKATAEYF